MISVQEAFEVILSAVQPIARVETVPLTECLGRVLAEAIMAPIDFPAADNSAMDGYAVRFQDVAGATPTSPVILTIVEVIPAEKIPRKTLSPGQAARIFTGGTLPPGADTIVIQEHTQGQGDQVTILQAPVLGEFVRHQGEYCATGKMLLPAGTLIHAPEIAILAAAQCLQVRVRSRPRVALISTGSELVAPGAIRQPGQIIDSNQLSLGAFVTRSGGIPSFQGIIKDDPSQLAQAIEEALPNCDILLTTGGASVGEFDYIESVLNQLHAQILIRSVAIKPGKPLTVATFATHPTLMIGLPGNPASALVGCWRFVYFALQKLLGRPCHPQILNVPTDRELRGALKRETYIWGKLIIDGGSLTFSASEGSQNSGNLVGLAHTTALGIIPIGESIIPQGAGVDTIILGSLT